MPCCSQKSKSSVSSMLVCDRCRLAAAASSRSLKRGETRKLTAIDFSAVITLWPCIELHNTCNLALQLQFLDGSESMGDHDSGFDDWWSVGRRYADAVGFFVERGQATDSSAVYAGSGRDLG